MDVELKLSFVVMLETGWVLVAEGISSEIVVSTS